MKKKHFEPNPMLPFVTAEEIAEYRSEKPETYTVSPLVNAFCNAIEHVGMASFTDIAKYMAVNDRKLSHALELITGCGFAKLRRQIVICRFQKAREAHPEWNTKLMAKHLGLADRSVLFRLLGRKTYDEMIAKYQWKD